MKLKLKNLNLEKAALFFIFLHLGIWGLVSLGFDVHADMADHWMAGRIFSLGYYEHPPMISWLMSLVNLWVFIFPFFSVVAVLKIFSLLVHGCILYQAFRWARMIKPSISLPYLFFLTTGVYFSLGALFINVDHPFLFFWILASIQFTQFLKTKHHKNLWFLGLYLGLAALSKYTALLFYLGLFVFGFFTWKKEKLLQNPHFWLAGAISLAVFSPVLYWNFENQFVSFLYQIQRGFTGNKLIFNFFNFHLSHLLLFSPFFGILAWVTFFAPEKKIALDALQKKDVSQENFLQNLQLFLRIQILLPLIFFGLASFRGAISDPKWLNISYISLFLFFLFFQPDAKPQEKESFFSFLKKPTWLLVYAINLFLAGFIFIQGRYNLFSIPQTAQVKLEETQGWEETNSQLDAFFEHLNLPFPRYVITREYQLGAWFALYNSHHPFTYSLEKEKRNLWSPIFLVEILGAVVICPMEECEQTLLFSQETFEASEDDFSYLGTLEYRFSSGRTRSFAVYHYQTANGTASRKE